MNLRQPKTAHFETVDRQRAVAEFKGAIHATNLSIRDDGTAVVQLESGVESLSKGLHKMGRVLACTGNAHAMFCQPLVYPRFQYCRCKGRALDPDGRMALLMSDRVSVHAWHEVIAGEPSLGLEWVNDRRESVHRCGLLSESVWPEFVRLAADGQPGGARGLRLCSTIEKGRWERRDRSAAVWVEPEGNGETREPRSWLDDLRTRRKGLPRLGKNLARPAGVHEIHSFISEASVGNRVIGVTVANEFVLQSGECLPHHLSWSKGTVFIEGGQARLRFSLGGLSDFWRVTTPDGQSVGYEIYDANSNLVLSLQGPASIGNPVEHPA